MSSTFKRSLLWTARILGLIILLFFLYFLIVYVLGIGHEAMSISTTTEVLTFVGFPICTVIGLALAWRYEGIGGALTVLGNLVLLILRPELFSRIYLVVPLIPGILFIWIGVLKRLEQLGR